MTSLKELRVSPNANVGERERESECVSVCQLVRVCVCVTVREQVWTSSAANIFETVENKLFIVF